MCVSFLVVVFFVLLMSVCLVFGFDVLGYVICVVFLIVCICH